MATKYTVILDSSERVWLEALTRKGRNTAPKVMRASELFSIMFSLTSGRGHI